MSFMYLQDRSHIFQQISFILGAKVSCRLSKWIRTQQTAKGGEELLVTARSGSSSGGKEKSETGMILCKCTHMLVVRRAVRE